MTKIEHYKQRLRDVMPYADHKLECAYRIWTVQDAIQKMRGPTYSAGPMPQCNCGFAALGVIIWAEVGTNAEPFLESATGPAASPTDPGTD